MSRSSSSGISCLICTYNGASRLAETLTCLARQVLPAGTPWEVILVDNASTDATAERARFRDQQVRSETGIGAFGASGH